MAILTSLSVNLLKITLVVYLVHKFVLFYRLRHFDGPKGVGFTRLWLVRTSQKGEMHLKFHEVNEKYGKFARVGPQTLLVSDIEFIRKIKAPRSPYRRSAWWSGGRFEPNKDSLTSVTDDEEHKALRAKMVPAYIIKGKDTGIERSTDGQISIMLHIILDKYISNLNSGDVRLLDWAQMAIYFAIDSITDMSFSEPLGDLTEYRDKHDFVRNMEASFPLMSIFICYTEFLPILQLSFVSKLMNPASDDPSPLGEVMAFARKCARERYGPDKIERGDMLDALQANGMDEGEATRGAVMQLVAGSEASATALRATVLFVATNPPVVTRLRAAMAAAGIPPPWERPTSTIISLAEARAIPYLVAVVREALRCHPPIVGTLEMQAPPQGDVLPDGRRIPGNTLIGVNTWSVLRDPDTFGPDAEMFRPERWLASDNAPADPQEEARRHRMERVADLVFGSGQFTCLGREIATMECLKVVAELFWRFDVVIANPGNPWHSMAYGIFCQRDEWVRITLRQPESTAVN